LNDETYIKLCIELAKRAYGYVSPNPLVGCVIVKNNKIIGAGFHQKYGDNHAEVNAINSAKESLNNSTLYVNLEPCNHFGNTPPCTERIIRSGIKRVVIGTIDINPLVQGRGIKALKQSGIEVKVGVMENECYQLNKFFFKFIQKKIPYLNLKIAQSLDGFIADKTYNSKWISSVSSRKIVHSMRSQYDAVLIGVNTAIIDNPQLNTRFIEGRNPLRIILDSNLKVEKSLKLITKNDDRKTIIFCSNEAIKTRKRKLEYLTSNGVDVIPVKKVEGKLDLKQILKILGKRNITSVLVEGGAGIFSSFIEKKFWDEINIFIAPKIMGNGLSAFAGLKSKKINDLLQFKNLDVQKIENDTHIIITKN
jgi:diaminohydroxyphosphoribosylaminopyrimidine deaminase/5-amino-6-(5-phosphoribosylamino)uracil reductase